MNDDSNRTSPPLSISFPYGTLLTRSRMLVANGKKAKSQSRKSETYSHDAIHLFRTVYDMIANPVLSLISSRATGPRAIISFLCVSLNAV